jgi:hypothetical protein
MRGRILAKYFKNTFKLDDHGPGTEGEIDGTFVWLLPTNLTRCFGGDRRCGVCAFASEEAITAVWPAAYARILSSRHASIIDL